MNNHRRPIEGRYLPEWVGRINHMQKYEELPEDERTKLKRSFINPISNAVHNMGGSAATELAMKLGAFLVLHDPDNEMAPLFRKNTGEP